MPYLNLSEGALGELSSIRALLVPQAAVCGARRAVAASVVMARSRGSTQPMMGDSGKSGLSRMGAHVLQERGGGGGVWVLGQQLVGCEECLSSSSCCSFRIPGVVVHLAVH